MKHISTNIISDFEFHDAYFKLEALEDAVLTISAEYVNIHKDTEQNPCDTDMEIETAKITFQKFHVLSFKSGGGWMEDSNGNRYEEPQVIFEGEAAEEKLLCELQEGITVFWLGTSENGKFGLEGLGNEPWFEVQFLFDAVTIQWDSYKDIAWYEKAPFKK